MKENVIDVNYRVADRDLKYYIFDWDDNILHMPTNIHLERKNEHGQWVPHSVSTAVFSVVRNDFEHFRSPGGNWEEAFRDFRDVDVDNENIFLRDTRQAIDRVVAGDEHAAPSFLRFKQTLIEGRLFAIVTARGHAPDIIRAGVRYFMDRVLSPAETKIMLGNLWGYLECFEPGHGLQTDDAVIDNYLKLGRYHGIMSPAFRDLLATNGLQTRNTEEGKQFAIKDFVEHVIQIARQRGLEKPISVGFSDDDVGNARAVEDYIRARLGDEFPGVKFAVYYTSDPEIPSGRKVEVRGQLSLPLT